MLDILIIDSIPLLSINSSLSKFNVTNLEPKPNTIGITSDSNLLILFPTNTPFILTNNTPFL